MHNKRQPVGAGVTIALLALGSYLLITQPDLRHQIAPALQQLGFYAPLAFIVGFAASHALGFPGNVLTMIGGATFGLVWGTVWSLLGATLGAIGAFWLARTLLHGWVEQRVGRHPLLQTLQRAIAHQPRHFVIAVRLNPLSPFSLVNFLFGLTAIPLSDYTIGTAIGIIPGTIAYAWIGASGHQALNGSDRISFYLALSFLAVLAFLPLLKHHKHDKS